MLVPPASTRVIAFHARLPLPLTLLFQPPRSPPRPCPPPTRSFMAFSAEPASAEEAVEEALPAAGGGAGDGGVVSSEEWRRWGTSSPLPTSVAVVIRELLEMEAAAGEKMRFGGVGSKLKVDFKDVEDKKHRAVYETLPDSDKKLQYYSARQIACRLLGSRGYLCQKSMEGNKILAVHASEGLPAPKQHREATVASIWHPSDQGKVSVLYPNKSTTPRSVKDLKFDGLALRSDLQEEVQGEPLNIVLLDGTWSNSAALYRRLKERWTETWGEEDIPCISLSTLSASVMHKLRPQPAWDRTCTAAAAAGLLLELHMRPELSAFELETQAEAVECSLDILLDALTARRVRLGRSIARKQRPSRNCL